MTKPESLADTIIPKSDQLNADDLLCGPITVTVESVKRGDREQPVIINIGSDHRPYKPGKSMRRVLIAAWGDKGSDWVGKSMTLYCDPDVVFGGVKVGGIRISHMSHIPSDRTFMLTATRGRKAEFHVKRLADAKEQTPDQKYKAAKAAISEAKDTARLEQLTAIVKDRGEAGVFNTDQVQTLESLIAKRQEQLT